MSTIQKRDSENQVPANDAAGATPELKKGKSTPAAETPPVNTPPVDMPSAAVGRTSEFIAAWATGRFNSDGNPLSADKARFEAFAEFFTEDVVVDVSSAAHSGVTAYKVHHGFAGLKEWFDFLGNCGFEGLEMSHVQGPAANEVWMRFGSATLTYCPTGKSAPFHGFSVLMWEGDKMTKLTTVPYNPAIVGAICSEGDVPIPPTVQLPAFEPHPSPLEPFAEMMALWGAGEFSKAEARREHMVADAVDDLTDSALPDVLKAYTGIDGIGVSVDHIDATWELSNVDAVPVAGLKPGCVMVRLTMDIKHKKTGKEAKGVQQYNEFAYDADGKFVYGRHYWVNAPLLASIY